MSDEGVPVTGIPAILNRNVLSIENPIWNEIDENSTTIFRTNSLSLLIIITYDVNMSSWMHTKKKIKYNVFVHLLSTDIFQFDAFVCRCRFHF